MIEGNGSFFTSERIFAILVTDAGQHLFNLLVPIHLRVSVCRVVFKQASAASFPMAVHFEVIFIALLINFLKAKLYQRAYSTMSSPASPPSSASTQSAQILGQNITDLIRPYIGYLTFGIDIAAGIIIGISAFMALIAFLRILNKPREVQTIEKESIRLRLARGMLLALDFEVGSDILKTILVPSNTELTILGVVVGIRIVLSWSLSKEIGRHSTNIQQQQNDEQDNEGDDNNREAQEWTQRRPNKRPFDEIDTFRTKTTTTTSPEEEDT